MIPKILVYWARDEFGVGHWRVTRINRHVGTWRCHTKLEALEHANELFWHEGWVILTVLNKDGSQDHCTSKFRNELLSDYFDEEKELQSIAMREWLEKIYAQQGWSDLGQFLKSQEAAQ